MNLGEKIKYYRNEKNLSQTELALKCGISRNALSNYERNIRIPQINVLNKLSIVLDIPLSELIPSMKPIEDINKNYYNSLSDTELKNLLEKSFSEFNPSTDISEVNKDVIIDYLSSLNPMSIKLNTYINNFDSFTKDDLIDFYNDFFDYTTLILKTFIENEYIPKITNLNNKLNINSKIIKEQQKLLDSYENGINLLKALNKK